MGMGILMLFVWIAIIGFWIWMLIDLIKNQEKDKVVWILVLIFTGILGAIVYFFVAKRGRKKGGK